MSTASIIHTVQELTSRYGTRNPYELCKGLGIHVRRIDLDRKLKGFFYYQSRIANIVIDSNVGKDLEQILVAHELGHAVLHKDIAMMVGFQEMEVFYDTASVTESEANLFSAELLLDDNEVLEKLKEFSFFQAARALHVPAALLDYKFSALCEKGLLGQTMEYRNSNYLKQDLHAYDRDCHYTGLQRN